METFSKKNRDTAMRIICDFYEDGETHESLKINQLHQKGLPQNIDPGKISRVLESMGYIEITRYLNAPSTIRLTPDGKCYFEQKYDESAQKRSENIRYAITTAIALAALIKSFLPEISRVLARLLQAP